MQTSAGVDAVIREWIMLRKKKSRKDFDFISTLFQRALDKSVYQKSHLDFYNSCRNTGKRRRRGQTTTTSIVTSDLPVSTVLQKLKRARYRDNKRVQRAQQKQTELMTVSNKLFLMYLFLPTTNNLFAPDHRQLRSPSATANNSGKLCAKFYKPIL